MIISIDFDNTIAIYDDAFRNAAVAQGLVAADFAGGRQVLRDRIRDLSDGETAWMRLQGYIYGAGIGGAKVSAGFVAFAQPDERERASVGGSEPQDAARSF